MAKKLVALLLAVAMVMSFALVAHAEDELVDGKFTTTRHITATPISMGLPKTSFTFCLELLSVMILRLIFLLPISI